MPGMKLLEFNTITISGEVITKEVKSLSLLKELPDHSTEIQDGMLHMITEEATPHTQLMTHTATSTGTIGPIDSCND